MNPNDESAYTPIVEGASPDNPIPTKQYNSAEEVHPNRQDYEEMRKAQRAMQYAEPKSLTEKLAGGVDWIILKNNSIRFKGWMWLVIFGIYWFSMTLQMFWLPASLSSIYEQSKSTFDITLTVDLINLYSVMVMIVFPAYVILFGILSVYESIMKWRKAKAV